MGDHRWQVKITQIDCNLHKPIDWRRGYTKLMSSPLWTGSQHLNSIKALPSIANTKYSTTFASGFQAMSQTASALAYELLKPQYTPRAPIGCLQYFTSTSGLIESFNFGQYLNNLDYSICIQRQPETCRVLFTSSDYDWSINGVGVSASTSGVGDQDCSRDYLMIPGGSRTGDGSTYDRYCGGRLHYYRGQTLSSPVLIKTSGPIVLRFHSDAHYEGLNNGGFRVQYDQSSQDCIFHTQEEAGSLVSQQLVASTLSDSRPLSYNNNNNMLVESVPVQYASQVTGPANIIQQQQSDSSSSTQPTSSIKRRQDDDSTQSDSFPEPPTSLWTLGTEAARWLGSRHRQADYLQQQQQQREQQHQNSARNKALELASELTRAFELQDNSEGRNLQSDIMVKDSNIKQGSRVGRKLRNLSERRAKRTRQQKFYKQTN